ncbi:nucleolin 1 isoform X2 [Daucus carota subsp. sativus]|uniref:nucleolin 1 isoform X2 n=1 Tax=Daucus carota subsp. sativus TaxID=79200 RepID=UPI0007EFBB34|nr:PREDICTED: nucleolin 1-like [Daucus carota subsp. sativus]
MGKSAKKSATKVAVAPAAAATKPLTQGKREAEDVAEKQQVSAKKQKQNEAALKKAVAEKIEEVKIPEKTEESGSEDGSDADDSGLEDDEIETAPVSSKGEDDASKGETDDESGDDEMPEGAEAEDGSSEEEGSEEEASESEEEEKKTPKLDANKATKTPSTPQAAATGGKTLFMGNLAFSVEISDVEDFFRNAGEIGDVRLAEDRDGKFKGFGHVEFATAEAAQDALKLNGADFMGRPIKLDMAREKGAYTPASGNDKGGKAQGQSQTVYVKGFDTSDGEDQVRSALEKHFGSCGDIKRVSIPQDFGGNMKGIAYVEFSDSNATSKALKLDGSELGHGTLTVQEAKPKDNSSGRGGGRGGGRRGGGGRSGGGRFGGGGRSGGGRRGGGGGRGRGRGRY